MPGVDLSQPLLGAGAQAKNDWAAASARTSLDFTAQAQFKRGFNVAIGLSALAQADAGLAKFVEATVRGNAFAEAQASLQLQFPLNLFEHFGVAVGAEAKAQAAAGIEVGLGLSVGDFVALIQRDPAAIGLPVDLVLLLLEEVSFGGKVEVHVAAAAMAYASLQIAGSIVDKPGKPAGFEYLVDAGLGLAAGMGFSGGLSLGFRDFRHFYGRAVDLCVDRVVDDLGVLLVDDLPAIQAAAGAFGPVAKLALRLSYELGDYIAKNKPPNSPQAALTLANHSIGILLEESQRFLLEGLIGSSLATVRAIARGIGQIAWDALRPQRRAVAGRLYAMPSDPFQPNDTNQAYWRSLQQEVLALANALPADVRDKLKEAAAAVSACSELLMEIFRSRINTAQAYVVAVGVGQINTKPSFGGPLPRPLLPDVQGAINAALGRGARDAVDFGVLASFVTRPALLDGLRRDLPGIDRFAQIFSGGPVGPGPSQVLVALLSNREAFLRNANRDVDPKHTLQVLLGALNDFITRELNSKLKERVYAATPNELTRRYFDEVLLAAINFTKDVAFRTVLDWEKAGIDRDTFTESLASVISMLLGRSLVIIGDQFFDVLARNMQTAAAHAARHLEGPKSAFDTLGLHVSPELERLFADTVRIGAEVFGPLPDDTRARMRGILYEILEPLPSGSGQSFVEDLKDQFFIPNGEHVNALKDELLAISRERFGLFAEKVLGSAGTLLSELIADFVDSIIATVRQWEKDLAKAIDNLGRDLQQLAEEIARLEQEVQAAFSEAVDALEVLLEHLSNDSMRAACKSKIVNDLFRRGKSVLRGLPLYQDLPRELRSALEARLKHTIRHLVDGPLVDPVLQVIGNLAGGLDDVIGDVRSLDPHRPLAEQVLELILDRMEDAVREHFGSTKPHLRIGFDFSYDFFGPHTVNIDLGRVEIPLSTFFGLIRQAVHTLGSVEAGLETVAAKLAAAFAKQFDLEARRERQSAKTRDRDRLTAVDSEHNAEPKEVTILTPAEGSVHGNDVRVELHLGGVPEGYLGLKPDEQQRVFVLLNGEAVANRRLTVVGSVTPSTSRPRLAPSGGVGFERSVAALPGVARTVVSTHLVTGLPGRLLPPSKAQAILTKLLPGTTATLTLPMDDLLEGANTLALIVIDRGGRPYQQVVSFGATSPAKAPLRNGVVHLPRPGGDGQARAERLPIEPPVGVASTPAGLQASLARAKASLRAQAELNLVAFKGGKP